MTRDLLHEAADQIDAAREGTTDPGASNRLVTLADGVRTQADREAPVALGTLDRIQHALGEIAAGAADEAVADRLESARERIRSFLETLDDRGMRQHGRN
jgi:hypothetical protein